MCVRFALRRLPVSPRADDDVHGTHVHRRGGIGVQLHVRRTHADRRTRRLLLPGARLASESHSTIRDGVSQSVWWLYLFPWPSPHCSPRPGGSAPNAPWPRCCSLVSRSVRRWDSRTCIRSAFRSWPIIFSISRCWACWLGAAALVVAIDRWRTLCAVRPVVIIIVLVPLVFLTWRDAHACYAGLEALWRTTIETQSGRVAGAHQLRGPAARSTTARSGTGVVHAREAVASRRQNRRRTSILRLALDATG